MKKSLLERNRRPAQLQKGRPRQDLMKSDENALKAFEMYVDEHKSILTIAAEMGVDRTTVSKYLNRQHDRIVAGVSQMAAVVREQQNSQLDQIVERWMPLALSEELEVEGEKIKNNGERQIISLDAWDAGTKATAQVLKALDQKAKINGLYTLEAKRSDDPAKSLQELMEGVLPSLQRLMLRDKPKIVEATIIENTTAQESNDKLSD